MVINTPRRPEANAAPQSFLIGYLLGIPIKQPGICLQVKNTLTMEVRWASRRGTRGEHTCSTRRRQPWDHHSCECKQINVS